MKKMEDSKVDWIEKQANKRLDFGIETRVILAKDAQTTLNWLFAMAVGSGGYVLKLFADGSFELLIGLPLIATCVLASIASIRLLLTAMLTRPIRSPGSSPGPLMEERFCSNPLSSMRMGALNNVGKDIEENLGGNHIIASAVDKGRKAAAAIPAIALLVGLLVNSMGYALGFHLNDAPHSGHVQASDAQVVVPAQAVESVQD